MFLFWLFPSLICIFIWGSYWASKYEWRENVGIGMAIVSACVLFITGIITPITYFEFLEDQRLVESYINSNIAQEYIERVTTNDNSFVDLDAVGVNLKQWYRDIIFANKTISECNYYNQSFFLDEFCPDWEAPDLIVFEKK